MLSTPYYARLSHDSLMQVFRLVGVILLGFEYCFISILLLGLLFGLAAGAVVMPLVHSSERLLRPVVFGYYDT